MKQNTNFPVKLTKALSVASEREGRERDRRSNREKKKMVIIRESRGRSSHRSSLCVISGAFEKHNTMSSEEKMGKNTAKKKRKIFK